MRVAMTFQTLTVKRFQDRTIMRTSVAVPTVRYRWVLGFVTERTFESTMLGLALGKHFENIRVACPTKLVWYIIGISDVKRAVRFVAAQTVFKNQEFSVRLVTLQTFLNLLMLSGMAESTILFGVFTGEFFEFNTLFGMASFTTFTYEGSIINSNV